MDRIPNPDAVPFVGRDGKLTEPWIRWFQGLVRELSSTTATANTPAPPPPTPAPAPDPGPATAGLISNLSQRVDGLEQLPAPQPDATLQAALQALQADPAPSALAARIAALERAINDLAQGGAP